jgi:hypothetical protein
MATAENANNARAARQDVILFIMKAPAIRHVWLVPKTLDAETLSEMA